MRITRLSEYAIRAMLYLASVDKDQVVNIRDIALEWQIPDSFLRKIIPKLTKAGLIRSMRGSNGGIMIARPADKITPLEVIESVDGDIILNQCLVYPQTCNRAENCATHLLWTEACRKLRETLASKSLDQLVVQQPIERS